MMGLEAVVIHHRSEVRRFARGVELACRMLQEKGPNLDGCGANYFFRKMSTEVGELYKAIQHEDLHVIEQRGYLVAAYIMLMVERLKEERYGSGSCSE